MATRRVHPLVIQAIINTTGPIAEVAERYGVSQATVSRLRPTRPKARLTPDQVIEVYTSTELGTVLAKRLGVSAEAISAVRRGEVYTAITSKLPMRARCRKPNRSREQVESERRAKRERAQKRNILRNAILRSRDPHTVVAAELGCSVEWVGVVRRAGGWKAPVRVAKVKLKPAKPKIVKAKQAPTPAKPAPVHPPMTRDEVLAILNTSRPLHPKLPWMSIIDSMPRPSPGAGPRLHKQVKVAQRINPGYLRSRVNRAILCRFYSVHDRPEPAGLGEPLQNDRFEHDSGSNSEDT